jgi:hypothetical protein
MLVALDEDVNTSLRNFESNLQKQEKNITEIGEGKLTHRI